MVRRELTASQWRLSFSGSLSLISDPQVVQIYEPVVTPENDRSSLSSRCRQSGRPFAFHASLSNHPTVSFILGTSTAIEPECPSSGVRLPASSVFSSCPHGLDQSASRHPIETGVSQSAGLARVLVFEAPARPLVVPHSTPAPS